MTEVSELVTHLRQLRERPEVLHSLRSAGREFRCWYAWPPSWVEWSWIDMNRSKFNATCGDWHVQNAYVAVTRLLAPKATSARHRFYWTGSTRVSAGDGL